MAKINELAKGYANYLSAMKRDKITAILEVESKINALKYSESGKFISLEDKYKILNEMERIFRNPPSGLILESESVDEFIILIQSVKDRIGK